MLKLGSFADDTRVRYTVKTINVQAEMQQDLDALYEGAEETISPSTRKKLNTFHMGEVISKPDTIRIITLKSLVKQKAEITRKDLGVHFLDTGTFTEHINRVVATNYKLGGYILCTFWTRERFPMLTFLS